MLLDLQMTFDAMCSMLASITEDSLLRKIEKDCNTISDAMLSIPVMIPGTRYYKGIKVMQPAQDQGKNKPKKKKTFSYRNIWFLLNSTLTDLLKQARRRLMTTFKNMIDRRRSRKEYREDFLQSMLDKDSYPPNEKLQDSEIMDNLLTLIIAGQTTTAAAIMWSVKFLDENKEAQDRLRVSNKGTIFSDHKPDAAVVDAY